MGSDWIPDLFAMEIIAATQVTITETTIALVASRIPLTELHCADVSLRGLTAEH
jgi:hypothetical protein